MKKSYNLITTKSSGVFNRKGIFDMYMAKYFNLFMGAYKIKNVTENQQDFILRRFWSMGKLAAFIVEGTKPVESDKELASVNNYPDGMIAFTDFAPCRFDIYDWPIAVNLVRSRGATFIPSAPQNVNIDVVIGYCQKNKMAVRPFVEFYVSKITDIEMTIRQQLRSHKVPWLIGVTPENEEKMKKFWDKINSDDDAIFLNADDMNDLKVLLSGNGSYIVDKLYQQKQAYENELLTYLGIDNLGTMQKKEHLQLDEANSNNELINDFGDCFLNPMKDFCERIKEYLGYDIDIEPVARPVQSEHSDNENENGGGENDDIND